MSKSDEIENLPACHSDFRPPNQASSQLLRDPLHSIPDPTQVSKSGEEKEEGIKARVETPVKSKGRVAEAMPYFRTPEQGNGAIQKNRFGWSATESRNVGLLKATTAGRPSCHMETTPTKSVSKPPNAGFAPMSSSRVPGSYSRNGNYAALSRGLPVSNGLPMVVNTVEVPHFDLKEDPSFWIHHNVQVIIRVRPPNNAERTLHGYNRCVKQENSQNITWIGQPESHFTFDHVACETVDQEMLFRKAGLPMVENCLSGYNSCMFAYGQTGSGKTFTMVGDIDDLEFKPSLQRGMTPRIFEYLFARIRAEEESRRDDQLKYSCKCSFLEIYNEQITDLLNPSATNLLLREDMRKGIYVENLSEFEVYSVRDILNLLAQGSLNRKVAATNMNMESSRSHSVFTCVIESKWERESTTNLRFARLNLVDLAGSERQKTSGAEGERLKEAANINKSLSTLGHVIMVLVDVANGKTRHVPYRDSKLTFLLQDSLGGNSKTIIIANISPSTSCAAETLNTLKFAQRAKLIQNNAFVNEDSSGDVSALQHQIQILKDELSALKRQPVSRSLSFGPLSLQYNTDDHEDVDMEIDHPLSEDSVQFEAEATRMSYKQLKSLEKLVAGALRREHMAETSIKKLEAEIEHLNRLVHHREEDARCSKMKLKFREDKIQRVESYLKGVKTVDSYLLEENSSLSAEIQMLQEKVDKNPEVTRFALENIRLLEELKRYQDFYEEGEREILLSEVSELRDKLIQYYDENNKLHSNIPIAPKKSTEEKEKSEDLLKPAEEILNLELELDILKIILKEERSSRVKADELATCLSRELKLAEESIMSAHKQYEDVNEQLKEAKSKIESLQSQQLLSVNELEDLKHKNKQNVELLRKKKLELEAFNQRTCHRGSNDCLAINGGKRDETLFQLRIDNMQASLEKAKMLSASYQRDHAFQKANEEEMDVIRQQVEEETAQVILCLQDELSALQQQVQDSYWKEKEVESRLTLLENTLSERQEAINALTCENEALREQIKEKEMDVELISKEWELVSSEIEGALTDGHEALLDASEQLDSICSYVPQKGKWVSEQVHRLIKQASEKDLIIEDLNGCLENANARLNDMECKLRSLKGATLVITESHQKECSEREKEIHRLRSELSAKSTASEEMGSKINMACDEISKTSKCATVAFVILSRLSELNSGHLDALKHTELQLKESIESNQMKEVLLDKCAADSEEAESQIKSLKKELESTEESCHWLRDELAKQQAYISMTERQLEEYHELDILKTQEKLSELQEGVSTMKSWMNTYPERTSNRNMQLSELLLDNADSREEYHVYNNSVGCPTDDESSGTLEECSDNLIHEDVKAIWKSHKTCKSDISKDATVTLLRKEIESALESLKEVQVEKVEQVEQHAEDATRSWGQAKEIYEGELNNATADVAKKTAEASCLFSKFEEAQDIMKEADVMIKGLMIANETMKLEMKDLKRVNLSLSSERDGLVQQIQDLHSSAALDNQQCHELMQELEVVISQARGTSEEAVLSMSTDISFLKSHILDSRQLIQIWLEDIWSGIIVKNSASSILHLCHMGILLETVARLNVENSQLNNGLCESDAIISSLREQNIKSVQELEAFNLLKEKLLADIKRSFDHVTSKENETAELVAKLRTFESQIIDFQLQEELMLERSNYLGFELAKLVEDLNYSNSDAVASLLEQEKLLNDNKEATISQEEDFMKELSAKDLELVIVISELQQLADEKADMETSQIACYTVVEHLKKEFVSLSFTSNLMQQLMFERDAEVIQLQKEVGEADLHLTQSCTDIISLNVIITALREELVLKKKEITLNEKLDSELHEALVYNEKLSEHFQRVENEYTNVTDKLKTMEGEFQLSCSRLLALDQQKKDLENQLKTRDEQLSKVKFLEQENHSLKEELDELKNQSSNLFTDVQMKDSEVKSCQDHIHILVSEKCSLQEKMHEMESKISFLQEELDLRRTELKELQCSHSSANEELCQKSRELQNHVMNLNKLEEENVFLKNELCLLQLSKFEDLNSMSSSVAKCLNLTKAAETESYRMCALINEKIDIVSDRLCQDTCRNLEAVARIEDTLQPLDIIVEDITSENSSLQAELLRKDEVLKGLSFDLSLLQESASSSKDQKDEIEELKISLSVKEDELMSKSQELDDVVANIYDLEAQMKEKIDNISLLEKKLSTASDAVELLSKEKADLTSYVDEILGAKVNLERELNEKRKLIESLEIELVDMESTIDQANASIESLKSDLKEVSNDRDHLHEEIQDLEEKLDTAQALAVECEAISMEAKQIAESNRVYGEEKEEEVKLLEISVQEVDILQEDAERQRLQREDLEIELNSLKHQIYNLESADSDIKRHLEEKEKNLQKALKHAHKLEKDLANKETEISRCRAHINELNLHAEAQASEYKKKFKALEAMAGQVKIEGPSSHGKSSTSNKLEKNTTNKPRGSGSPFKCIGIGLAQQLKLEKDEDLTAERLRIQELEALAANRQKESLLDKQQVQKIAESAILDNGGSEVKVEEISKLKKLLSDFVEERKGWLEEIDRRQAELVAAQLALEKLHQKERSLTAENEVLKVDVGKYKKKVVELEEENEDLSARLGRADTLLMCMKERIAGLLPSNGIMLNYIEEEKRLSNKLKESEEERVQLAQELLGLCTSILKAAGIKKPPSSDISVATAEEALKQLRSKFSSLEREVENFKLKSRIEDERIRLSEIMMMQSPPRQAVEDKCTTPRRASRSPFFSAVDR
ncbi:hypothetical protein V2J09_022220 [Rumex salicifolius]